MGIYAQFEVDMPDDPKIIEVGDLAELVYYRAIMRCREHLTDGVIDRRVVGRWFAGIRGKTPTHLAALVAVGLLLDHPDGWCIPPHVWTRRNPTKAAVEAKRDAETERKRLWKERHRDADATTSRRDRDTPATDSHSHSNSQRQSHSQSQEDDNDALPGPKPSSSFNVEQRVAHQLARHYLVRSSGKVGNPNAWVAGTRKTILDERIDDIRRLLSTTPNPDHVAAEMANEWTPTFMPGATFSGHPSSCDCQGTGWLEPEDDSRAATVQRCPVSEWPDATIHQLRGASA